MPPAQHTFGTTGNAPSYPGAGVTPAQISQTRPLPNDQYNAYSGQSVPPPAPRTVEVDASHYTSPTAPGSSVSPNPYVQNPYAQNPYNGYDTQMPQEPVPAYAPNGLSMSPDLLAARREHLDVEAQIQHETNDLNNRLNNPGEDPERINFLHDSIRKLYLRKGVLMQRIQDLQDSNSYAYQQSQAMTANITHQTPPMNVEAQNPTLSNDLVVQRDKRTALGCISFLVIVITIVIVVIALRSHSK
ncbi:hypothetical protein TWF730_001519 [Orbilia blumenaviensis]|uniref:Uncharacterized protein n=1 Tax=Orbilia blumenaviensis TaxID=1796055 RepID=A0AAV9UHV5_9PEZI